MFSYKKGIKRNVKKFFTVIFCISVGLAVHPSLGQLSTWNRGIDSDAKFLPPVNPNEPMKFSEIQFCCGSSCPAIILAEGLIQVDTAKKFTKFLNESEIRSYVCFNSIGGNLKGGIALGREIRRQGLDTCLLNSYIEGFEAQWNENVRQVFYK